MSYRTPGVYVEEISKLPASVAQSETAIPVFIGYTEKSEDTEGNSLENKARKIESMMDFEILYGGPKTQSFKVTINAAEPYLPETVDFENKENPFRMHHALNLFYANGGGPCFIVSVGAYMNNEVPKEPDYSELKNGLDIILKNDEITLVVIPEASLIDESDQYELYKDILMHCNEMENRFGIFDVRQEDHDADNFRNGVGTSFLNYGAAYYPHLNTTISHPYNKKNVFFSNSNFADYSWDDLEVMASVTELKKQLEKAKEKVEKAEGEIDSANQEEKKTLLKTGKEETKKAIGFAGKALDLANANEISVEETEAKLNEIDLKYDDLKVAEITDAFDVLKKAIDKAEIVIKDTAKTIHENSESNLNYDDIDFTYFNNNFTSKLTKLLDEQRITMPPSPAIAGVYARVDTNRGVWKSPANVSLNRITAPAVKLTISENDRLNVDSSGKSINAIRSFTGKGTLVWGARTLDGGSNEWRYISVRRFFNMVEDSVKNASARYVFEANDANTWIKVKSMIENFLTRQWRSGALMGAKPEDAFYVQIGLGKTMTQEDVLEGKMIIEIGMAVVRPAEFIVLRFSHKMMEL